MLEGKYQRQNFLKAMLNDYKPDTEWQQKIICNESYSNEDAGTYTLMRVWLLQRGGYPLTKAYI